MRIPTGRAPVALRRTREIKAAAGNFCNIFQIYIVDPCGKQFKAQFAGLILYLYTLYRSDRSERKKKNKTQTQQKLDLVVTNSFFASNVVVARESERDRER